MHSQAATVINSGILLKTETQIAEEVEPFINPATVVPTELANAAKGKNYKLNSDS